MYIDSHQHFWNYNPKRDTWITDQMSAIKRDFYPLDLKEVLEQNRIDGCVAVQASQTENETQFLLALAEEFDFIKAVVGWVDLFADNLEQRLSHFSNFEKFKGIRHVVQDEPIGFMNKKEFQNGIAVLGNFNLSYDILIKPPQLKETIALVEKFPKQKFVLDHIAKPQISKGLDQQWADEINTLGKYPNVYCKLSGMVTETDNFKWKGDNFKVFLEVVTKAFTVDRLMFGSDWPVCLVAATYQEVLSLVTDFYDDSDLEKVMGENAVRFYNLNDK